jgi:DNA mismatch repair protein MutS
MRHPIIEKICTNEYITHNIVLGKKIANHAFANHTENLENNKIIENKTDIENKKLENNKKLIANGNGILLYGINSSGKSSIMKAVGLNLIMAQAGMYVACEKMVYSPYKTLLTRILNNDNIHKGLSSYAVEMEELRGIAARADENSLVLGDEVCHGTETISAISIVAASVEYLCKRKTSFIFATHLHQLMDLEEVQQIANLGIYNIKVVINEQTKKLEYSRELEEGSGDPLYGIEVAKMMGLNNDIILTAYKIRKKLLNINEKFLNDKKSRYNAKVFMDMCTQCKKRPAVETHHHKPQKLADENGFIESMHKNHISNLKPLCHDCHTQIHD